MTKLPRNEANYRPSVNNKKRRSAKRSRTWENERTNGRRNRPKRVKVPRTDINNPIRRSIVGFRRLLESASLRRQKQGLGQLFSEGGDTERAPLFFFLLLVAGATYLGD